MKTKIKICVGVALLLAIGFIRVQVKEQHEISLLNVEALAGGESGSSGECFHTGSVDCPHSGVKVYIVY